MDLNQRNISDRLGEIQQHIKAACEKSGRQFAEVELMAVTKTWPAEVITIARSLGVKAIGENRVQEAADKRLELAEDPQWELIGHLQRNKARAAVKLFRRIQSVDRISLIDALNRLVEEEEKAPFPILLQINAGKDPAKYGADLETADKLVEAATQARHLQIDGFMSIAPFSDDPEVARACFRNLREFRDQMQQRFGREFRDLSMGMSGDLAIAIEEGSTMVRVGSALFGQR